MTNKLAYSFAVLLLVANASTGAAQDLRTLSADECRVLPNAGLHWTLTGNFTGNRSCLAAFEAAQAPRRIGARVRLTVSPREQLVGTITVNDGSTITLAGDSSGSMTVRRDAIVRLERSNGRSREKSAIKGGLLGAGVGAGAGALVGLGVQALVTAIAPHSGVDSKAIAGPIAVTAPVGALIGASFGAIGRPESWATVPAAWLDGDR